MRRGQRDEAAKCPGKCRGAPNLRESEAAEACRRRLPRGAGRKARERSWRGERRRSAREPREQSPQADRKSTRLNSSHLVISYAVFCLKKKKKKTINTSIQKKKNKIIVHNTKKIQL